MPKKSMETLTEAMLCALMAFCQGEPRGTGVTEWIDRRRAADAITGGNPI